ncbi:hypothetical protein GWI33_000750 [Rhynchophorus ferrugineus]|uniref:Uncharacterized protein n=1 Tax=Rhynchophorus ferrugineus TaxID=354439 RepID=A0A834HSW6_RHYFE|nr:hypothetical protein GWI33_000750 [Rhynchophorus ferrugineus]
MIGNTFTYMKSGALEKISPALIQDSGRNFGKLKFIYNFSKNVIKYVDSGGLHPDYPSYVNVQTEMMFKNNEIYCSCENIGWLFSELGQGPGNSKLKAFYDKVIDEKYSNLCHKCSIPLKAVKHLIANGKCLTNITIEPLCKPTNSKNQLRNGLSSNGPKLFESSIIYLTLFIEIYNILLNVQT